MDKIRVIGGNALKGTIVVKGAKNAVLPLMACALLTDDEMVFENVPHLADINTMTQVLRHLGADVTHENETLRVRANAIRNFDAPYEPTESSAESGIDLNQPVRTAARGQTQGKKKGMVAALLGGLMRK